MKDVNQLLGYPKLAQLMMHLHSVTRLNETLQAILPPPLRGQVTCVKLEKGILTIIAPNGSFSTQIRFSGEAIIAGLNEALTNQPVKTIRCIVRPHAEPEKEKRPEIRRISSAAAEGITASAATMSNDKLRAIWEKLGKSKKLNDR
ncbi:MAG: DUF721 domain-containing protein [Gammaproteobacteria bacterium]|nr:DUF721 domain-containing protein [Gammaproteobacteria bacterium]